MGYVDAHSLPATMSDGSLLAARDERLRAIAAEHRAAFVEATP